MADYVAFEDDNSPPRPAIAAAPAARAAIQLPAAPAIPDDPSNIPLSPSVPPQPLHPHAVLARLFNWAGRSTCNRLVLFCYPMLLLLLAGFILTVGLQERTASSGGGQLSLWLVVSAMLIGCMSAMLFTLFTLLSFSTSSAPLLLPLLFCAFLLHSLFTFVWFVIGNVWFTLSPLPGSSSPCTVVATAAHSVLRAAVGLCAASGGGECRFGGLDGTPRLYVYQAQ